MTGGIHEVSSPSVISFSDGTSVHHIPLPSPVIPKETPIIRMTSLNAEAGEFTPGMPSNLHQIVPGKISSPTVDPRKQTELPSSNQQEHQQSHTIQQSTHPTPQNQPLGSPESNSWNSLADAIKQGPSLPKIELIKFAGDPSEYTEFSANFRDHIESQVKNDSQRLTRLLAQSPPIGNWFHVAAVWDRNVNETRLFLDAQKVGAEPVQSDSYLRDNSHAVYDIGLKRDTNETLRGYLRDLMIIGRALSDEELTNITDPNNEPLDGVWIGLNDFKTEGAFYWPDGSHVTYTKWASNQPDNQKWLPGLRGNEN
ncbi:C-type lectin domain 19 member A [Desmophyllum pertusum]|uniref:C-type lectin domain 19 member A n=1 Tax=Desmophyllum pertusum TaxID=174260 RepID=A0A9X0CMT2_9CNID|nr:C-type lectin domain 19 member A [Desmophyllum pertusum]